MRKVRFGLGAIACLAVLLPCALAQSSPTVYTFVGEWTVPRAQWAEFTANAEKTTVPILERLVADGTLVEFAMFANTVHGEDKYTHGFWWTAASFAGLDRALAEIQKTTPAPLLSGLKHRDRLLRSIVYRSQTGGRASAGYSWTSFTTVQPGKGPQWREAFDKYNKPIFEKLLADGVILGYGVDQEFVHTEAPSARISWYNVPSAEALDKVEAAIAAARQSGTPEANRGITAAFAETTVPGTHRDGLDRILHYAHK